MAALGAWEFTGQHGCRVHWNKPPLGCIRGGGGGGGAALGVWLHALRGVHCNYINEI